MPFNSDSQFWSDLGFMTRRPLKDAEAALRYIAKLDDVPRYFDQQIANMRAGLKRGFSVPRAVLDGRDVSIASYADAQVARRERVLRAAEEASVEHSGRRAEETSGPCRARDSRARDSALRESPQILPRRLRAARAHDARGAEALPDGKAYYRQQIREYTTLDLDPEAIHEIGLREVARIDAEMQATMKETRFRGRFPRVSEVPSHRSPVLREIGR